MGFRNREVEIKLLVEGEESLDSVNNKLSRFLKKQSLNCTRGISDDIYWKTLPSSKADFIRLRHYPEGLAQITVKHTDKGDNFDRVEIDLEVADAKNATLIISSLQGKPIGKIKKKYIVYFLDDKETNVSLYQIANDKRVFIEIEARSKKKVFYLQKKINDFLSEYTLSPIKKSLYQIFLKK